MSRTVSHARRILRLVELPLPLAVLTELVGFSPHIPEQFREVTEQMWSDLTAEGEAVDFAGRFGQLSELMAAELPILLAAHLPLHAAGRFAGAGCRAAITSSRASCTDWPSRPVTRLDVSHEGDV